jgi:hypothetical protein
MKNKTVQQLFLETKQKLATAKDMNIHCQDDDELIHKSPRAQVVDAKNDFKRSHAQLISTLGLKEDRILGRQLTKTIFTSQDRMIGKKGDRVTKRILTNAIAAGVLDQLLKNSAKNR